MSAYFFGKEISPLQNIISECLLIILMAKQNKNAFIPSKKASFNVGRSYIYSHVLTLTPFFVSVKIKQSVTGKIRTFENVIFSRFFFHFLYFPPFFTKPQSLQWPLKICPLYSVILECFYHFMAKHKQIKNAFIPSKKASFNVGRSYIYIQSRFDSHALLCVC